MSKVATLCSLSISAMTQETLGFGPVSKGLDFQLQQE